jgi:hypothetical protein
MILKALNKIYKIVSDTLLSTLHCSGEMKLWKFWEVWTQNSNNFNLVKRQLCTFISPSWSWIGLSYLAVSSNSIRKTQLQSLRSIWHVLGHLEFSAQLCIFWTPKNGDFGPRKKKFLHTQVYITAINPFQGAFGTLGDTWNKKSQKIRGSLRACYVCLKKKITFFDVEISIFLQLQLQFSTSTSTPMAEMVRGVLIVLNVLYNFVTGLLCSNLHRFGAMNF